MSTIKVNSIKNTSTDDGGIAIDNSGHVQVDGVQLPTTGALSNRNLIINGSMVFDQRNSGSSVTPANAEYLVDRWKVGATQSSKFTAQQSTTAPTGFKNSLLLTSSSAFSLGASDEFEIIQFIEGNNVAHLGFGTSSAQTLTLSFYARSSLTGTFGGAIYNGAANRSYPFTYTISTADTFELQTVTFAGDTSGTWATDNTAGINVLFSLGAGSSKLGTAGAWTGSFKPGATGQTNLVATNGATLYLSGVQLEVGEKATPFEHRSYGDELAKCQRYCFKYAPSNQEWIYNESNNTWGKWWHFYYPAMRDTPSFDAGTLSTGTGTSVSGLTGTISSIAYGGSGGNGASGRQSLRITMSADSGVARYVYHTDSWVGDHCFCFSEL